MDADTNDIVSGLNDCITKDGQNTPIALLPMGGLRHTGVGNAQARTDYAAAGQVQDSALIFGGVSAGSANAQTITTTPAVVSLADGQQFIFRAGFSNTTATTLSVNGLTHAVTRDGGALTANMIVAGQNYVVTYNLASTRFELPATLSGEFPSGTKLIFPQASAPTGWTQDVDANDVVLRIVSGTGAGTGGSWTISGLSGTAASHTHTGPSHTHTFSTPDHKHPAPVGTSSGATDLYSVAPFGSSASGQSNNNGTVTLGGAPQVTLYMLTGNIESGTDAGGTTAASGTAATGASGTLALTLASDASWRPSYLNAVKATKN